MQRGTAFLAVAVAALVTLASAWLAAAPTHGLAVAAEQTPQVQVAPSREADPEELHAERFLRERRTGLADGELARVAATIVREARRHDLDPSLVLGVIRIESGGYTFATSRVGALGLMQLMPPTGHELARAQNIPWHGEGTLFDPVINVRLGTQYLRQLADRYDGDLAKALAAYNWGPGRLDRRLRRGASLPTRYANDVLEARAKSQQLASVRAS